MVFGFFKEVLDAARHTNLVGAENLKPKKPISLSINEIEDGKTYLVKLDYLLSPKQKKITANYYADELKKHAPNARFIFTDCFDLCKND
jgi:hypothetical protein